MANVFSNQIMNKGKYFPRSKPPCPMSDPANPHSLCRRSDPPLSICFSCKGRQHLEKLRYYYYCDVCDLELHRGCHLFPTKVRHPFHLLHPLTLTFISDDPREMFSSWDDPSSDSDNNDFDGEVDYGSDPNYEKCKFCGINIGDGDDEDDGAYYHCSICSFSIHVWCAMNKPPLSIEGSRIHDHTLTLFSRQSHLPCDACGFSLSNVHSQVYSCQLCNYLVHRSCIYLPRVIKITRHPHRLSYTPSSPTIPSSDHHFPCGVCRRSVDVINYGHYSCNKGCHYALHPNCATKKLVWDGKDLEGVPEEEEEKVIEPFVRIDAETIQHFSHEHHYLRFDANSNCDNNLFCQACTLEMTVLDRFYSCMECDFVLHERCASLPRKTNHPLHKHTLTLFHPFSFSPKRCELRPESYSEGYFWCNGCHQLGCGFFYKCDEEDCDFQLDVRCASLSDPSSHELHDHPLFFNLTEGECMGCKKQECSGGYLECTECNLFLGLACATLPSVAHYKYDKHPLTLCYGEKRAVDLQYWCEICETKLDSKEWFYTCNFCRVTLHVRCLLGEEIYLKPNHTILILVSVDIIRNKGNVRPVCDECGRRCIYPFVFKWLHRNFCSWRCAWAFI